MSHTLRRQPTQAEPLPKKESPIKSSIGSSTATTVTVAAATSAAAGSATQPLSRSTVDATVSKRSDVTAAATLSSQEPFRELSDAEIATLSTSEYMDYLRRLKAHLSLYDAVMSSFFLANMMPVSILTDLWHFVASCRKHQPHPWSLTTSIACQPQAHRAPPHHSTCSRRPFRHLAHTASIGESLELSSSASGWACLTAAPGPRRRSNRLHSAHTPAACCSHLYSSICCNCFYCELGCAVVAAAEVVAAAATAEEEEAYYKRELQRRVAAELATQRYEGGLFDSTDEVAAMWPVQLQLRSSRNTGRDVCGRGRRSTHMSLASADSAVSGRWRRRERRWLLGGGDAKATSE